MAWLSSCDGVFFSVEDWRIRYPLGIADIAYVGGFSYPDPKERHVMAVSVLKGSSVRHLSNITTALLEAKSCDL